MNRYIIISSTDIDTFLKSVENHLEHGFILAGGISVLWEDKEEIGTRRKRYYQALSKKRIFKVGREHKSLRPENQTGL